MIGPDEKLTDDNYARSSATTVSALDPNLNPNPHPNPNPTLTLTLPLPLTLTLPLAQAACPERASGWKFWWGGGVSPLLPVHHSLP